MMRFAVLGFVVACFAFFQGAAMAQAPIAEGQVWTYKNAPADTARVVIQKIEKWGKGEAVHISLYGLPPVGQLNGEISHMPFDRKALEGSLDTLTVEKPREDIGFMDGYRQWKSAQGGVFTLSIADALKAVLGTVFGKPEPPERT